MVNEFSEQLLANSDDFRSYNGKKETLNQST